MVKKLRCTDDRKDWVQAYTIDSEEVCIGVKLDGSEGIIILTPENAKKLRKQIKKALIEIEGEPEEDIAEEKEEPEYIPHVGDVVEVYRNTTWHHFDVGERVRIVQVEGGEVRAESLDGEFKWWVDGDIRPVQDWKPKEGEKVLIVDSTYVPSGITRSWIGNLGFIGWSDGNLCKVYNEDKSDYFGFRASDLRPVE